MEWLADLERLHLTRKSYYFQDRNWQPCDDHQLNKFHQESGGLVNSNNSSGLIKKLTENRQMSLSRLINQIVLKLKVGKQVEPINKPKLKVLTMKVGKQAGLVNKPKRLD